MLPLISLIEHTFIDIDNHFVLSHVLNIVSCSQLPLELRFLLVVSIIDGLHFLVGETQLKPQIAIDHTLT